MERVQFQQEQMLAELKDLVQKGLFTQKEVKQIMQKRTAFETALVRRIPKKSDFLRYATYEMSLEALRRKRAERLKLPKGPPSVSDYALVRRQFQIFERALKKFKGDVGLWIQYIQVAKKEGARALVGRITARALQLHPNVPALYVLAASHELEHLSPSAARALLQRGLRLNADSVDMWREYVKMELNFIESLRRRWSVLGIDVKGKGKETVSTKKRRQPATSGDESGLEDEVVPEEDGMEVDGEVEELSEDEAARKQIMEGAIVRAVISNAVKAVPKIELFSSLHNLISTYPSPPSLRETLLDHLHGLLHDTLPSLPAAIKLSATRRLTADLSGEPLVDALRNANDVLSEAVRTSSGEAREGIARVYTEFIDEWCGKAADNTLKAYLITSAHLLIQQLPSPIPDALLAAHVRLLVRHHASLGSALLPPKVNSPEKILRVSRKYTTRAPSSATVWLARLEAEKHFAQPEDVQRAWQIARGQVEGDGLEDVWLWGLAPKDVRAPTRNSAPGNDIAGEIIRDVEQLEHLLPESKRIREPAAASAIHEVLLMRYAAATHRALLEQFGDPQRSQDQLQQPHQQHLNQIPHGAHASSSASAGDAQETAARSDARQELLAAHQRGQVGRAPTRDCARAAAEARLARVRRLAAAHTPSARVWAEVFRQEREWHHPRERHRPHSASGPGADAEADAGVLRAVYEYWRQQDGVEATAAWAEWLLRSGRGSEAVTVVGRARSVLGEQAGEEVERRWKAILDGAEAGAAAAAGEDADADDDGSGGDGDGDGAEVTGEEP
ncbi:U3 small nucleolar RNA-associated protein 6-domain-containing protein [Trametes polyzona]|nr:U3 small nucleolar RNA-associated protein 6-domain-containing protein [Trametes polyzona]